MEIKKRISEIDKQRKELLVEREAIQAKCEHESYEITDFQIRVGRIIVARVCTECSVFLGQASTHETISYIKHKPTQK